MKFKYIVWCDSESKVQLESKFFFTKDEACDYACTKAHQYDFVSLVILHVDNKDTGETIETYESFIKGINY